MKSNGSNFITRQQVEALMCYKFEQVLQHRFFHLCWRKFAVLLSCVGIALKMEACTMKSSVRFKQRILIEFLTFEGVSANKTGICTTMSIENELGYTAK
jgi:hypothetical protein